MGKFSPSAVILAAIVVFGITFVAIGIFFLNSRGYTVYP